MLEYSLGLLKPDCLKRRLESRVFALIASAGLEIVVTKTVRLTKEQVAIIWPSCVSMGFYEDMVRFSTSGDSIVFIVQGENAIQRLTALVGHYDPTQAVEGTIRRLFGTSAMENVIHSSSDKEAYQKEKSLFFRID